MTVITIKRGGNHPILGDYIGGADLDDKYCLIKNNSYRYTAQLRNIKQLSANQAKLMDERNSTTTMKFDGNLEPSKTNGSIEMSKEDFL